jgi:hypothetical protein
MHDDAKAALKADLGFEIGGPGRVYYDDVVTDNVVDALLELAAMLWTVRDRQIVLEKVLAERGLEVESLIESYTPTAADNERRREEREAMVAQVFRSFLRRPEAGAASDPYAPSRRDLEDTP